MDGETHPVRPDQSQMRPEKMEFDLIPCEKVLKLCGERSNRFVRD